MTHQKTPRRAVIILLGMLSVVLVTGGIAFGNTTKPLPQVSGKKVTTIYHGASCQPWRPATSEGLIYKERGIWNFGSDRLHITCPIERHKENSKGIKTLKIYYDNQNTEAYVGCVLTASNAWGDKIDSVEGPEPPIPGGGFGKQVYVLENLSNGNDPEANYYLSCGLPGKNGNFFGSNLSSIVVIEQ